MRRKEPWFKFYSTDYLCDDRVDALPLEAQGLLVRMWCVCNQRGAIPDDTGEIARLTQCKLQDVLRCYSLCKGFFQSSDGILRSIRMDAEKARSEIARTNAAKRYVKDARQPRTANGIANSTAQKVRDSESSESESESEKTLALTACAVHAPVFITLPLNDKSAFPIDEPQVSRWQLLYPGIDVRQQLRNYAAWADANPVKRKTRQGILRSMNSWLAKEQDKYKPNGETNASRPPQRSQSIEDAKKRALETLN